MEHIVSESLRALDLSSILAQSLDVNGKGGA